MSSDQVLTVKEAINLAFDRYYDGQFADAQKLVTTLIQSNPDIFELHYLEGLLRLKLGDQEAGIDCIDKARELHPYLAKFDFLSDPIEWFGTPQKADIWQRRFEEYKKHNLIENYIISFPKCGRTWLRAVLGKYAVGDRGTEGDPLEIVNITHQHPAIPTTEASHDDSPTVRPSGDLITDKSIYADKRVLFLVRDPRDVLVSFYFQYSRRGRLWENGQAKFDGSLTEFIRHPAGSLANLVDFYNIWARNQKTPKDFLMLRYEDLRKNSEQSFKEILTFFQWPDLGSGRFEAAVEFGRFDNLHEIEKSGALENLRLDAPEDSDPEGFKVRRGIVGGYRDYLEAEDIKYIDNYLKAELDEAYNFYKNI
jgi:hypothetical protein